MASPIVMTNIIRHIAGTNAGAPGTNLGSVAVSGPVLGASTNGILVTISNRYAVQFGNQNITNWGTIPTNNLGKQVTVTGDLSIITNNNLVTIHHEPIVPSLITNKTLTNTWVVSNISDSNVTALLSFTADGSVYQFGWATHMHVKWDGTIDAQPELKAWVEYTTPFGFAASNLMFDLLPYSGQYQSYHIENTYSAGGAFWPNIDVNTDYGWTAGGAILNPRSNTTVTIWSQRIGSPAIGSGGMTNVANYVIRLFQ